VSDDRPRPRYGEYATPEQQAKAAGLPLQPPPPDAAARVEAPTPSPEPTVPIVARNHSADRFVTLFLLGVGLITFLNSLPEYLRFSSELDQINTEIGLGAFPMPALADKAGIGMLVAHAVLLLLTMLWALRALFRGRRGFFIPLIGFAVFAIVYIVVLSVLFHADPTFWAQVVTKFGGAG
jgi:hypothetical protein